MGMCLEDPVDGESLCPTETEHGVYRSGVGPRGLIVVVEHRIDDRAMAPPGSRTT